MNKGGYVTSMIGGVLALVFSVLILLTGPLWTVGGDVSDFFDNYQDRVGSMWELIGKNHDIDPFLEADFNNYVDEYTAVMEQMTSEELQALGDKYDSEAFRHMAAIAAKLEELSVRLWIGATVCLLASVAALIGAQVSRHRQLAGGVTVLCGAILTLGCSLLAGSVLPMLPASLLLLIGALVLIGKRNSAESPDARGREVL